MLHTAMTQHGTNGLGPFEAMAEWLRGRGLAAQKLPEQLELAQALPRNASGKILKRELQQRYRDA